MANEDLLLRQMPHSLEGEQAVLGSMLIDEGCVKDVMDKLVPSDFYLRQNREIFETIYTMFTYARPIDGITVCEEMQKAGTYDENTTRSYLAQLMEITPTSANVMEYVAIVRDKALLRGVAQAAGEITVLVQEGMEKPLPFWKLPSRRSTPSAAARVRRIWCLCGWCCRMCWTGSTR